MMVCLNIDALARDALLLAEELGHDPSVLVSNLIKQQIPRLLRRELADEERKVRRVVRRRKANRT